MSQVTIRTLQRIENNKNSPRSTTLQLICDALGLDISQLDSSTSREPNYFETTIHYFFLIIINLVLMTIVGWMTLDSEANFNSRAVGLLLSFFIPFFIINMTRGISRIERFLKFGLGFLLYGILTVIIVGFPEAYTTALLPSVAIYLMTLFYGDNFFKKTTHKVQ